MTEPARKLKALITLGIARQAPPDEATQRVYLEALSTMPADVVEIGCTEIARVPRGDFESAYPPVARILDVCRRYLARRAEATQTSQLLMAPADTPVSPERLANFRADVEEMARRKRMA